MSGSLVDATMTTLRMRAQAIIDAQPEWGWGSSEEVLRVALRLGLEQLERDVHPTPGKGAVVRPPR